MRMQILSCRHEVLMLAIAAALAAHRTDAATITVNSDDDSAPSALCNLRNAIASINNGSATANCTGAVSGAFGTSDTIVFGSMNSSVITLTQGELSITKPMTITGSGQSIDGDGKQQVLHLFYGSLTANNLSIQNGYSQYSAGGIYLVGGTLALTDVTVLANVGGQVGGILAFQAAQPTHVTLTRSTVAGNSGTSGAGGIFCQNGDVALSDTSVSGNVGTNGGGIAMSGGTLTAEDSIIANNSTGQNGGGVSTSGMVTLTRSSVTNNSATGGGGISTSASQSVVRIVESTISNNTAMNGGGLGFGLGGTITLVNSTLSGNSATTKGGAIYGEKYPHIALTNSTLSANTAASGGGFFMGPHNSANTFLNLSNSIASANAGGDFAGTFSMLTGTRNLLGTALNTPPFNSAGNQNVFSNTPGLGSLTNNGGPTATMALLAGSPAIDAGSNANAVDPIAGPLTTDQRGLGFVRIHNLTVDIGAYEYLGDTIFTNGFEPAP